MVVIPDNYLKQVSSTKNGLWYYLTHKNAGKVKAEAAVSG